MAGVVDIAGNTDALAGQRPAISTALAADNCFVAADVGGTNARVGLVRGGVDGSVEVLEYRRYPCSSYPSLTTILAEFVDQHLCSGGQRIAIERMAIASAGVVLDGEIINSNLPWRICLQDLRQTLGLRELHVINDFAAAAHGAYRLPASESRLLTPAVSVAEPGPTLVLGPGTGLGAALCVPHAGSVVVVPTEAGLSAFAPGNEREGEILAWMRREGARHVSTEQLLSGPGLVNLYNALCALADEQPVLRAPAAISLAARQGAPRALEAVQTFCALLGSVIGDLALVGNARSVHVAGGIVPQLVDFLPGSAFHARLVDKGAMRAVLERVPVRLVENEKLGVLGAASWYLQYLQEQGNKY